MQEEPYPLTEAKVVPRPTITCQAPAAMIIIGGSLIVAAGVHAEASFFLK